MTKRQRKTRKKAPFRSATRLPLTRLLPLLAKSRRPIVCRTNGKSGDRKGDQRKTNSKISLHLVLATVKLQSARRTPTLNLQ